MLAGEPYRVDDEVAADSVRAQKLMERFNTTAPADPQGRAEALADLLGDDAERARLGAIGRERIGGPGALAAILAALDLPAAPA